LVTTRRRRSFSSWSVIVNSHQQTIDGSTDRKIT
jgi:hypothetical protein